MLQHLWYSLARAQNNVAAPASKKNSDISRQFKENCNNVLAITPAKFIREIPQCLSSLRDPICFSQMMG
jgi:hypothetical protein